MGEQDPIVFHFPIGLQQGSSQEKVKEIMGTCFKTFKGTLYKKFIPEGKEPNWDGGEYTKQKDFWQEFRQYRESEEYLELSRKNNENLLKATNPHYLGSRGYASKMDGFESELEMLERLGVEAKTANWEPISIYFCMARGYTTTWTRALAPQIQP